MLLPLLLSLKQRAKEPGMGLPSFQNCNSHSVYYERVRGWAGVAAAKDIFWILLSHVNGKKITAAV
jgi:hypothetical protein